MTSGLWTPISRCPRATRRDRLPGTAATAPPQGPSACALVPGGALRSSGARLAALGAPARRRLSPRALSSRLGGPGAALRAGAGAALLLLALVGAVPAQAQSTCPDFSVPSGRVQIWTGTVTVGQQFEDGLLEAHGYSIAYPLRELSAAGSLDDTTFETGGNSYSVQHISVRGLPDRLLSFGPTPELSDAAVASLRLHVCGETYSFSNAFYNGIWYVWATGGTGLDWSSVSTRTLYLTRTSTAPFFNDSRWGDSILWLYENPASPFVGREGLVRRVHYLVKAIDPDGDSVRYTLEGRDAQLFSIDEEVGWLLTRPHVTYDYETEERTCYYDGDPNFGPCYVVRVRATDIYGASTTQGVTIHLEDKDERLIQRFRVEAPAGTNRELRLSWSPVSPDERPESYWVLWNTPEQPDYRNYRQVVEGDRTSTTIGSLEPDTVYRVRMRPVFTHDEAPPFEPWTRTVLKATGSGEGPDIRRAEVLADGRTIELEFDEALDKSELPDGDAVFTVSVDGVEASVASTLGADIEERVRLTLTERVRPHRTVSVAYEAPASGRAIRDENGHKAGSFTVAATNSSGFGPTTPGVGPAPVSAEVPASGTAVFVVYDEPISPPPGAPRGSDYQVTVDGSSVGIFAVTRHASDHNVQFIALTAPITQGQTVTVGYTDQNPGIDDTLNVLQDTDGNDAESYAGFPVTNNSEQAGMGAPPEPLTAELGDLPTRHTGEAFTIELAFSEELPVSEEALRAGLAVTGGTLATVAQAVAGESRSWDLTVTPSSAADAVTVTLTPKESCTTANAICTADGRGLSGPVEAEVPGREPTRVVRATVTSDPGENGTWDTGETVTAAVVFNRAVAVQGPPNVKPTLGVLLGGARREAELATTGSADTFVFRHTVTAADDGADTATVAADGITLNGTVIADNEGNEAILTFATGPALSVADATATEGDDSTADFVVTLDPAATGTVTVDYATADGTATAPADYASTSGTLTFAPGETSKTVSVAIVDDTVEDDGETFTLTLDNAAGATLADATATGTVRSAEETDALTAEFKSLPEDGHGGAAFSLKLKFSEEFPLSYLTLRDHALGVTGGTVTKVSRATTGENKVWAVTVTPAAGAGDVTVTLAATSDCAAAGALCTADGRALSAPVSATVPETVGPETTEAPAPFRVRLEAPGEHDGTGEVAFRVLFNKDPVDYSYVTLRDSTVRIVRAGTRLAPTGVKRLNAPASDRWSVKVAPGGKGDLTVSVGPFASCSDTGAVCAAGGEVLANAVTKTILGPPGLSVADARVDEAPGATVDFPVTLARASKSTVTVDYATADGTGANAATAGADYTATSDTLTFAPGETAKTVSVAVLDDSHDEGEETFTLTLSNPQGGNAWLADATATGTIVNTDAMPKAWLARFGRTVAEQVIDAVGARLRTAPRAGVEATLAGEALPRWNADGTGAGGTNDSGTEDAAAREAEAQEAEAKERLTSFSDWLRGGREDGRDGADRAGLRSRAVTERDLLTGTSFALSAEAAGGGLVSLWGRGAVSRFDGREGDLSLDGEVASAMMGADWTREAWTAGLLVSHSRGEGGYRGAGEGTVTSSVTGLYPYGRYMVNPRVALWGVAGYGEGTLTLTPKRPETGETDSPIRTDMDLTMAAAGLRGVAVEAPAEGGVELAVTSDAMVVRTSSEKAAGLAAAEAEVTRLRLGLEGSWRGLALGGGELTPRLEVGVRHDGGDAETGFGLDLGGGLAWSHPESGVSAELRGRGLLTHESRGFRDRGLSGSFAWDPGRGTGRGPKLTLTQTVGASASGGADALLGQRHLGGLAVNDNGSGDDLANRRLELRLGYGFGAFGDRFTSTPELGLGLSQGRREYTLGWRLDLARRGANVLQLKVEATRRESANPGSGAGAGSHAEHALGVRLGATW